MTAVSRDELPELLTEWETREEAGERVRLDELCAGRPEMLGPVREQVARLRSLGRVLDVSAYAEAPADGLPRGAAASPPGYRILQVLGRGGMGVVYKAWQERLERVVALKMILAAEHADDKTLTRFAAEARLVARVQHANIVQVFEVGAHDGRPFIALEYLAGGTLQSLLLDARLAPVAAARLVETLARAVHYAHQQQVIHRDLKPANILFTRARVGPDGTPELGAPKIADFGLARQLDADQKLTATGSVMGTPAYMAPEQAAGRTELLGPAADVYSLGVILDELLAGRVPFTGRNEWEVIQAVIGQDPAAPGTHATDCPPELEAVCLRCLRKSPAERYPSAEALADDLARYLAGEQPAASKTFKRTPARPPSGRLRRGLTWGGAVAAFALALGLLLVPAADPRPLKLGLLVSLRGSMDQNGSAVADAARLAVEELNARRVLDRRVELVLPDVLDEDDDFGHAADRLVTEQGVCTLLGGWRSADRKAVLPVLEKHGNLLIYPAEFEGLEQSPHVVYLGALPNQIILPAVDWFCREEGVRELFLVGSDELFDRAVNAILRAHLEKQWPAVRIVGEEYVNASDGLPGLFKKVAAAKPQLIVNTISGQLNIEFFTGLRDPARAYRGTKVLSVDCTEQDMRGLTREQLQGNYLAGSYFESLDTPQNREFLRAWHDRFGPYRVTFDVMEAAYVGVHLWARAVKQAGGEDPPAIREALLRQEVLAPEGRVRFDPWTGHAVRHARLARYEGQDRPRVVWGSDEPVAPVPFPATRPAVQWQAELDRLYEGWGRRWTRLR
jgi:urea transport system substrate-binding protein